MLRAADVMRLATFGWYFSACLGVGIAGGWALDKWLDTRPGFLLGGLFLGSVVGFYGMYRMLKPYYRARK